jgi:hypothetical protein
VARRNPASGPIEITSHKRKKADAALRLVAPCPLRGLRLMSACFFLVPPEILEARRRHLGIARGVLDVSVTDIGLQ